MNGTTLKQIHTRFRAYSLGTEGASYSLLTGSHLTLIEARVTEKSMTSINWEMRACGRTGLDVLHITSWDMDHCKSDELSVILEMWKPLRIEYPGYEPDTDNGKECLKLILDYKRAQTVRGTAVRCVRIDPIYISSLATAQNLAYRDVVYHPRTIYAESNNNSTVQLFRKGAFNVASLGDVEHTDIGAYLRRSTVFSGETDVLVVPHHGAENPILTRSFLKAVKPTVAICSNDYDDKFGHPADSVRELFEEFDVPLMCTKTGDVLVETTQPHGARFYALNAHGSQSHQKGPFYSKKSSLMAHNLDSIRNRYRASSRPVIR